MLLGPRSKASKLGVLVSSPSIEERLPKVNRMEAKRIRKDYGFGLRHKALRGESHEHFEHEIRLKVAKSDERQDGNQTMQVFQRIMAIILLMKLFSA